MLFRTILLWLFLVEKSKASSRCQKIAIIYIQTEEKYFDNGCDEPANLSPKQQRTCTTLQKKKDIFGQRYYNFGPWSDWSDCQDGQHFRIRRSCTNRQDKQTMNCSSSAGKLLIMAGYLRDRYGVYPTRPRTEVFDLNNQHWHCNYPKYPEMMTGGTGGLLGQKDLMFCGGGRSGKILDRCYIFEGKNIKSGPKLQTKRYRASSVVINDTTLWVTGGVTYQGQDFKAENLKEVQTTELVTLDKSVPGPDLIHMPVKGHCLISVSESKAMLTGGMRKLEGKKIMVTKHTYFYDFRAEEWSRGPWMTFSRFGHGCAAFQMKSRQIYAVAGGIGKYKSTQSSVELFDPVNSIKWIPGPSLPERMINFALLPSMDNQGLITTGSFSSRNIFEMTCMENLNSCKWTPKMKTNYLRDGYVALWIPNSLIDQC